jgi:hypothetical protein
MEVQRFWSGKGAPETRLHFRAPAQASAGNVQGFGKGIIVRLFGSKLCYRSSAVFGSRASSTAFKLKFALRLCPILKLLLGFDRGICGLL